MGSCTIPRLFGLKRWFDSRFEDDCAWHDERYVARDVYKIHADLGVSIRMARKSPKYIPIGVVAFVFLTVNPVAYIMWWTD